MTVGMVTARSHGGLSARRATRVSHPLSRTPPAPRSRRGRTPALKPLKAVTRRAALARLAKFLAPKVLPIPVALAVGAAVIYYNRKVEPEGFPGFDNIAPGWRNPVQAPLGFSPGDFIPNPFDHRGEYGGGWEALVDTNECALPAGCRYWGDFPDSVGNPYPDAKPGINWPTVPQQLPAPQTAPLPVPKPQPLGETLMPGFPDHGRRHRLLPNLAIRPKHLFATETKVENVVLEIILPNPGARPGSRARKGQVRMRKNEPPKKQKDIKAKPASRFIWLIMKRLANAGGEAKEWVDILAEASGYDAWKTRRDAGFKHTGPRTRQDFEARLDKFKRPASALTTGITRIKPGLTALDRDGVPASIDDGFHETLRKAYFVFMLDGLKNVDFDLLLELVIENEIEDRIFAIAGRASKFTAQGLGLTVGPQTGLVL